MLSGQGRQVSAEGRLPSIAGMTARRRNVITTWLFSRLSLDNHPQVRNKAVPTRKGARPQNQNDMSTKEREGQGLPSRASASHDSLSSRESSDICRKDVCPVPKLLHLHHSGP
jgi:hypothetical protein